MAKAPEKQTLTLDDFVKPPRDKTVAEYQRLLATNFGWQDGPREKALPDGSTETLEFGAPHEHIAKTLLGVALRDLRTAVGNQRVNAAREKILRDLDEEFPSQ